MSRKSCGVGLSLKTIQVSDFEVHGCHLIVRKADSLRFPLLLCTIIWVLTVAFGLLIFALWATILFNIEEAPAALTHEAEEVGIPMTQTSEGADGYAAGHQLEASTHQEPSATVLSEFAENEEARKNEDKGADPRTTNRRQLSDRDTVSSQPK